MNEVTKSITIESSSGLTQLALQSELYRQAMLCATADAWQGNAEPGSIIHLDDITLYNVKFITTVEYSEMDATSSDAVKIKIDYIAYEK